MRQKASITNLWPFSWLRQLGIVLIDKEQIELLAGERRFEALGDRHGLEFIVRIGNNTLGEPLSLGRSVTDTDTELARHEFALRTLRVGLVRTLTQTSLETLMSSSIQARSKVSDRHNN